MPTQTDPIYHENPAALLQKLIQFDTTNPPGDERECITFINGLLTQAGIETQVLARTPNRPNILARLPGAGNAPPLLLYGHVDVVTTKDQQWQHPPFEGKLVDGYIWGRGALDMKSGVAMLLAAFLRARYAGAPLPGDIILAIVADEEDSGHFGAKFLVQDHPEQFQGVRHALGEFGGFTLHMGGRRFYPIQISEKQICQVRATMRGLGGHGSMPERGGAMAKLSRLLHQLDKQRLPVHITSPARMMIEAMASSLSGISGWMITQLLNPPLTNFILDRMGGRSRVLDPLLHNTVSPTILQASDKINVIPSKISLNMDGRLLPGLKPADLIRELKQIAGDQIEFEVVEHDPGPGAPDMAFFDDLAAILREADPGGIPIPLLLSGVTDGRFFAQLGIQTYGFLPMQLPEDFNFAQTVHAADERIPAAALEFGTAAIHKALARYHA